MNKKIRTPFAAILLIVIAVFQIFEFTDICIALFNYKVSFGILSVTSLAINLALCGILFAKKYNNILVIVLGCQTLIDIVILIRYFSISDLLVLVADTLLTIFALAVCEQTFLKTDLSKTKKLANKLFYLPAILYLACEVYCLIADADIAMWMHLIPTFLYTIVLLNLGMWLKDPYSKENPVTEADGNSAIKETQPNQNVAIKENLQNRRSDEMKQTENLREQIIQELSWFIKKKTMLIDGLNETARSDRFLASTIQGGAFSNMARNSCNNAATTASSQAEALKAEIAWHEEMLTKYQ